MEKEAGPSSTFPWPTFPEDIVVRELRRTSTEFRACYDSERPRIIGHVHWAHDPSLPKDGAKASVSNTGILVIRLSRIPPASEDAVIVAHELVHLVLTQQFPSVMAFEKHRAFGASLNSMLHDPLVEARLAAYGFDTRQKFEEERRNDIRQLERISQSPSDRLTRLEWAFNYVQNMLDWKALQVRGKDATNPFHPWFDSRYPDIAIEAKKLLALVERAGFDTPEKMRRLLEEIIETYQLSAIVRMRIPSSPAP